MSIRIQLVGMDHAVKSAPDSHTDPHQSEGIRAVYLQTVVVGQYRSRGTMRPLYWIPTTRHRMSLL